MFVHISRVDEVKSMSWKGREECLLGNSLIEHPDSFWEWIMVVTKGCEHTS